MQSSTKGIMLMIAGSRSLSDIDISPYIPDNVDIILSGGAKGVDTLAEEYADKHGISKLILRPKYNLYKRNAPLVRNRKMVDLCDAVIVFWDGKSRGTKYTIDYARQQGKIIKVIEV